jgi:hypothetical protein
LLVVFSRAPLAGLKNSATTADRNLHEDPVRQTCGSDDSHPWFRVGRIHGAIRVAIVVELQLHSEQHYLARFGQADHLASQHRFQLHGNLGCDSVPRGHSSEPDRLADDRSVFRPPAAGASRHREPYCVTSRKLHGHIIDHDQPYCRVAHCAGYLGHFQPTREPCGFTRTYYDQLQRRFRLDACYFDIHLYNRHDMEWGDQRIGCLY